MNIQETNCSEADFCSGCKLGWISFPLSCVMKLFSLLVLVLVSCCVRAQEGSYFGLGPLGCPSTPSPALPPNDFNNFMYQEGDLYPLYLEWWTVTFHDQSQVLGGEINFFYVNSVIPFTSYTSVNPIITHPKGLQQYNDKYDLSDFSYSSDPSSITVNSNSGWTSFQVKADLAAIIDNGNAGPSGKWGCVCVRNESRWIHSMEFVFSARAGQLVYCKWDKHDDRFDLFGVIHLAIPFFR